MSCAEREELLNGMLDGQLAAEACRSLETHLLDCPGCRARLEALQAQHRDLEAAFAPVKADASDLASRLAAKFEAPRKARPWRLIVLATAAAAAGMMLAFMIPRSSPPPEKVVVKVVDPREKAAWAALEEVHAYARKYPQDPLGFAARCVDLSEKHAGTGAAEAARAAAKDAGSHLCTTPGDKAALDDLKKQLAEAVAKAKALEETERELAALDEALNGPAAREQFAETRRLLEQAKARKADAAWTAAVEQRRSLLEARIAAQGEAALAAAKAGNAKAQRERVAAWGIPDALVRFDRDLGPIPDPPKEPVVVAAAKKVRLLTVIGNLLLKGPEARSGDFMPLPVYLFPQAGALCSLETEAGDILRLNSGSRLSLEKDGRVSLEEGELFVMSKAAAEVACGPHKISAGAAIFEVSSRNTAGQVKGPGRRVVRVTVLAGEVKIDGRPVQAGELCRAVDGRLEPTGPSEESVLATQWLHPLLRGRREDVDELQQRSRALASLLDDARIAKAAEQALRLLGSDAVPGLLSLMTGGKGVDVSFRKKLAGLAADVAGPSAVPDLVDLLHDQDPAVRVEASRGLERITGLTQGQPRTIWAGAGYERGAQVWETWLERNGSLWGGVSVPKK